MLIKLAIIFRFRNIFFNSLDVPEKEQDHENTIEQSRNKEIRIYSN